MCLCKAASEIVRRTQRSNGGRSEKVREGDRNKIHSKGQRSTGEEEGIGLAPRDLVADAGRWGLWDGLESRSRIPSSVPEKRRREKRKKGGPKNGRGQGRAGIWVAAGVLKGMNAKISTTDPSFIIITYRFPSLPTASLRWKMTRVALGCGRHSQQALLVRPLMLVFWDLGPYSALLTRLQSCRAAQPTASCQRAV